MAGKEAGIAGAIIAAVALVCAACLTSGSYKDLCPKSLCASERAPTPTASPSTGPPGVPTTPAALRVHSIDLRADPFSGTVVCDPPVVIRFSGRINAIGGSGSVLYRWVRSDNAAGPVQTLTFTQPGSQTVETSWRRGPHLAGTTLDGWEQIEILDPPPSGGMKSDRATFNLSCS
jgi:hypothetical protein